MKSLCTPLTGLLTGLLFALLYPANLLYAQSTSDPLQAADKAAILPEIYQLVDKRQTDLSRFQQALSKTQGAERAKVLVLLGRLGDPTTRDLILPHLDSKQPEIRRAAAFALGQMPAKQEPSSLTHALFAQLEKEQTTAVKTEIWLSLGRLAPGSLLSEVMHKLPAESEKEVRKAMFQALAIQAVFHPERAPKPQQIPHRQLIELLSSGEPAYAPAGLFLSRIKDIGKQLSLSQLVAASARAQSEAIRLQLLRLIRLAVKAQPWQSESDPHFAAVRRLLSWVITRSETGSLNERIEAGKALISFWSLPQARMQIGKLQASSQPLVSSETLFALADSEIEDEFLLRLFKQHLKNTRPEMQLAAIQGLVKRQSKEDMSWVISILRTSSAFNRIRLLALLKEKAKTNKAPKEFDNFIRFLTQDNDQAVAEYAEKLLTNAPTPSEKPNTPPDFAVVNQAVGKTIRLTTGAGIIDIRLLGDAPYTAWQIQQLVNQGYFNGSYFHRVIGNFVAQGGDPIGDGEGSSGLTIREEISFLEHEPLTVGIATSGKDTGSSQFFINTGRNYHLDRNYTIFGKVVSEPSVLERLVLGTQILKAEVIESMF